MKTLWTLITGCLVLGGCQGGIPTSPTPESSDEQRKPGLFTGKKGYFEIMPQPAKEITSPQEAGGAKAVPENTPKRTALEELAAS